MLGAEDHNSDQDTRGAYMQIGQTSKKKVKPIHTHRIAACKTCDGRNKQGAIRVMRWPTLDKINHTVKCVAVHGELPWLLVSLIPSIHLPNTVWWPRAWT